MTCSLRRSTIRPSLARWPTPSRCPPFLFGGATCSSVTTSGGTAGYLPYFDTSAGCVIENSIVFEDAANSRIGIGRTNPQQKLDVYQAGGSTRIQVFADQSLSPGFRIQQNTRQAIDLYNPTDSDDFRIWVNGAARVAVTSSGNVGVGTTNPIRPLHVKGGDVAVEGGGFGLVDSGISDPSTVLYEGGSDVTILRTFDVGQSPAPAATLLNIWAPPESGSFPTANRETTLTLQRATNDETYAEYLDLYNNYYPGDRVPRRNMALGSKNGIQQARQTRSITTLFFTNGMVPRPRQQP